MKAVLAYAALAVWLAVPALARSEAQSRALFIEIAEDVGCILSEREGRDLLPKRGMSMNESERIVEAMIDEGTATFKDGTLRLTGDICHSKLPKTAATTDMPDDEFPGEKFLRLVRENGCSMNEDQAEAILPRNGIDLESAEDMLKVWVGLGLAEFDGDTLVLGDGLCGGFRDAKASPPPMTEVEAQLMFLIRRNGCALSEDAARAQLPSIGLDLEAAEDIIKVWRKDGLAEFKGNMAVLSPDQCTGHGVDDSDTEARKAIFVAILEHHDCAMTEDTAEAVLPSAGFEDKSETKRIVADLMASGKARLADDKLTLQTENCR